MTMILERMDNMDGMTQQERCYDSEIADGHDKCGRPVRQNYRLGRVR